MLSKKLTLVACLSLSYSLSLVCSDQQKTGQYEQLNTPAIELQTQAKPVSIANPTPDTKAAAPEHNTMSDHNYVLALVRAEEKRQERIDCAKDCCCYTTAGICCIGSCGIWCWSVFARAFYEYDTKEEKKRAQRKALHARLLAQHRA